MPNTARSAKSGSGSERTRARRSSTPMSWTIRRLSAATTPSSSPRASWIALAAIQSGFPFTVSVPDGAPPARDEQGNLVAVPEDANDVAPEHDEKYRYIFNN